MKLCVFGAASDEIDDKYIKDVEELAKKAAARGHELVFGAGACGLMGAAARGFKSGGAHITGVIPEFFKEESIESIYNECDELIYTENMRERKSEMEDRAEAFIIVPGGIGTFEEMFEVLTLKQLGRHNKPIVIYNIDGYYDAMEDLLRHSVEEGFVRENCEYLYKYFTDGDELIEYVEKNIQYDFSVEDLKNG